MTKTCRAKNRDSESPPITSDAEQELHDDGADHRHATGHRAGDRQPPVGVGIPTQHLAAEEHAERAEQQEHADDPGQLARILVRSVQETCVMWASTITTMPLPA